MYKGREMVLEPSAQLCMVYSCRETSDKDAGFVRYFITLSVNLGGSYGDGR